MPVRKTESRIPFDLQPSDLGQAVSSGDGRSALVSFVASPLVVERENTYVVFVTDTALSSSVENFEWSFSEHGGAPDVHTTEFGEIAYTPQSAGTLNLTVRLLDSGDSEQARLELSQEITTLHNEIETLIAAANETNEPGIGNPDVARELVNDHSPYYQDVTLQTPESGDSYLHFLG